MSDDIRKPVPPGLLGFDAWARARERDKDRIVFGIDRGVPPLEPRPRTYRDRWRDVLACLRYLPMAWKHGWPP